MVMIPVIFAKQLSIC